MIRYETFSSNVLAEKKRRRIGETRRHKICKDYVDTLDRWDLHRYIEGPIRFMQGNKPMLESEEPIKHTFRLWILSEALISLLYFIPVYRGMDVLKFKTDVLAKSMGMLDEAGENFYADVDKAFKNIILMNFDRVGYDDLINNISIVNHYITGLAIRNRSDAGELTRGMNTIIRQLENK